MAYILAFSGGCVLLSAFGYTNYSFAVAMVLLSLIWLERGWQDYAGTDNQAWGRRLFGMSLIVLLGFSLMLSLNSFLP